MKIAVYGREFHPSVVPYVQHLFDSLIARDTELWIYKDFRDFLEQQVNCPQKLYTYATYDELPQDVGFMLSLGGDGTMLAAVAIVADSGIPVAGINFGRLGFLADISKDDIDPSLEAILIGEYNIQKRTLLSVQSDQMELFGGSHFALNDITLFKSDSSAMITVSAYLNGELLNAYWADGIIVATPTGSTAYSLSCGGPIITPGSGNFVITPISPHNLNVRPVVISDDMELDLEIESRSGKFLLSCDSKTTSISTDVKLKISKAHYQVNLIRLKNYSYFANLRNKLLWGLDARNY
ncbi:NAD kinase [Parapedobacter sp. ISTM3]|uniref:NAD kinase n=1 Tax=Parapedobacter luteus TaxID=623280 RepID=A0A1T5BEG7_9SPHI|nr:MULTISPECIES: NAD kinase [Parapedobacter]MBK1439568.1 NAD kinase [Parapedobacter sp. ISTM3]SKB45410.1 NAD+ kinase [Parapedobacter luteus]